MAELAEYTIPKDRDGFRDDEDRVELFLEKRIPEAESPVIYRKYISTDAKSDFQPSMDHPWVETYTDVPPTIATLDARLFMEGEDGERHPITLADGCIFEYHGRPKGQVGMLSDGTILTEEDCQRREEVNGRSIRRFIEWGFHLIRVVETNGPELTEQKQNSNEQQRNQSESKMFQSQTKLFEALFSKLGNTAPENVHDTAQSPGELFKSVQDLPENDKVALIESLQDTLDQEPAPAPAKKGRK